MQKKTKCWKKNCLQTKRMADISDGAIVGSAIIKLIEKYGTDAPEYVAEYVKSMKDAIRS